MDRMRHGLWTLLLGSALLWLAAEPTFYEADTLCAWREVMTQLSGVLAFGCMSAAMGFTIKGWINRNGVGRRDARCRWESMKASRACGKIMWDAVWLSGRNGCHGQRSCFRIWRN